MYLKNKQLSKSGWASIAKGGEAEIQTEAFNRSKPKRLRHDKLGPAWVLGPEYRSDIETKIPNHFEVESIEPRPAVS